MRSYTPEQFWQSLVGKDNEQGCWLWNGTQGRGGYGKITYHRKTWSTHRLAWTLKHGPIPTGKQVNHSCDVRLCCNPHHLFVGTQLENIRDAVTKNRMASGDRQGLRVHPDRSQKGERNGSAKLNSEQVAQIRNSGHLTDLCLANQFGVSEAAVRFARIRRTWKHI